MTIQEFVDEYKAQDDAGKIVLAGKIVNTEYISYINKVADCQNIVKATSYTNTEPNMFKINSPARNVMFELELIHRYTELDIDFRDYLNIYDKLNEIDAIRTIISQIPTREVMEYRNILDMTLKDFQMNERSMIGYFDSKLASLKIFSEEFLLNEYVKN